MSSQPQLFLAPCSNRHAQAHFNDTVLGGVNVEEYRNLIPSQYQDRLSIWGTGENNQGSFRRMGPGDIVLFYVGDRTYSHSAVVRGTERNEQLDEALWTPYEDRLQEGRESWPFVMYLEDPVSVNISSVRLHQDLGRNDEYPLGFTRVASGLCPLITEHDGLTEYLESISTTAMSVTDGEEVLDMYTGPRGGRSASERAAADLSDDELYERAKEAATTNPTSTTRTTTQYSRSSLVREYARRRASGTCEGCGNPAPFDNPDGEPYLEVHHLQELSDEGPDDPDAVAALCPNCHKRIHQGRDGSAYNRQVAGNVGFDLGS